MQLVVSPSSRVRGLLQLERRQQCVKTSSAHFRDEGTRWKKQNESAKEKLAKREGEREK